MGIAIVDAVRLTQANKRTADGLRDRENLLNGLMTAETTAPTPAEGKVERIVNVLAVAASMLTAVSCRRTCATTWSPLLGCTVVSLSPWNTMVGTGVRAEAARLAADGPWRIVFSAEIRSCAAACAKPEWMPAAANRSG